MRLFAKLAVLIAVLLLFTGPTFSPPAVEEDNFTHRAQEVEEMLTQMDEELAAYRAQIQKAGEELFEQKSGELRREQAQRWQNELNKLQAELDSKAQQLQAELSSELLTLQLQLMLVTLKPEEQQHKLERINQLQTELATGLKGLEEDFAGRVEELQTEYDQQAERELLALQAELERAMDAEFQEYQFALLENFQSQWGSAMANRSY